MRSRHARFVLLAAAALAAPAALPGAAGATAAPKAKTCPAGSINLSKTTKLNCAKSATLLPTVKPGANQADTWLGIATDTTLLDAWRKRYAAPKVRKVTKGLANRLLAKLVTSATPITRGAVDKALTARPLADGFVAGPANVSTSGTSATVTTSATMKSSGSTAKLDLGITASAGEGTMGLDLGLTVTDAKGASRGTTMSFPIQVRPDTPKVCPTADGVIDRASSYEGSIGRSERKTVFGLDWLRENTKSKGKITLHGQVGGDAKLSKIAFDGTSDLDYSFGLSGFDSIYRVDIKFNAVATISGTIDPSSGAVTVTNATIDGTYKRSGNSASENKSEASKAVADGKLKDQMLKALRQMITEQVTSMKAAETRWQTPNTCASLTLDPGSAQLSEGQTASVSGTVKASDGAGAAGNWSLVSAAHGQADTLPGTSAAGGTIPLTMTGGAPASDRTSVDVTLKATSPAGVAQGSWTAKAPDVRPLHVDMKGDFTERDGKFGSSLSAHFDLQPQGTSGRAWITSAPVVYDIDDYFAPGGECPWTVHPEQPTSGQFKAQARRNEDGTYTVNVYPTVYLVGKDCVENAAPPEQILTTATWMSTPAPNYGVIVPSLGATATRLMTASFYKGDHANVTISLSEAR
jgi:hypothetical protein